MTETLGAKGSSGNTKKIWEVSPFVVFGLCGFTLYLAWMFMIFISPTMAPTNGMAALTTGASPTPYLLFRSFQLIALLATLLIAWRASDVLSGMRGVLTLLASSVVLITVGFLILALLNSSEDAADSLAILIVPLVASACLGVGQGLMILLWSSFLCMIGEHRILLFVSLCIGCAAGLVLVMSFLQPVPTLWITLSLAWLSLGSFAYIRFRLPETPKSLLVKAKASDKRQNIHVKSTLSVIVYSIGMGFAVCFIACSQSGLFGIMAATFAVILAAVITGLDATRFHVITESLLAKLHMPALVLGIAPLFFDDPITQILGCAFLLCFFMIVFIVNLTALSEHVRIFHLNSIRVFGSGRAGNAFGFLVGGFFCYLAFFAPYTFLFGPIDQRVWSNIFLLVLLVIFVLASSFVFEDHYPASRGANKNAALAAKAKAQDAKGALPRGDLHTLSTYMLAQPEVPESVQKGIWTKRIATLSKDYSLSPKETEVLFLLAKGRNAEYIQNELVVSRHTAKAHIYHIYQKTGVHSRQALIDMLENIGIDYDE